MQVRCFNKLPYSSASRFTFLYRYLSEGFQVIIEKSKDAKCSLKDVQLRFLCPDDLEEVKDVYKIFYIILNSLKHYLY